MPKVALLAIDVQSDFCAGGALEVPTGDEVVPVLNRYVERFEAAGLPIVATRDWHPRRTKHFKEFGGLWPVHCVQNTSGAEFHPDLRLPETTIVISAGMGPEEEGYSGFEGVDPEGRPLGEVLRRLGVEHVYVGGLATDYCVKATALDALQHGFQTTLLVDASRGVNVKPGDAERAIAEVVRAGADVTTVERLDLETEVRARARR